MARNTLPHIPGLPDRYELRRTITPTAYGYVLEAVNRARGSTLVALKTLNADGSHAHLARQMYLREVEALKGLDHVGIVKIIDSFEVEDGPLVIELELVPGGATLSKLFGEVEIGRETPPSTEWRVRMCAQMCEAVLAAHKRDVIHRDIKPGNVLWNRHDETLKLSDFGIAAVLTMTARDPTAPTLRNFYTRPWASREQRLQESPTSAADVYSFGLLAAALLALREPGESFEPAHLPSLVAAALMELRSDGASEFDTTTLGETLSQCLRDDPKSRPSLMQIRDVLLRIEGSLIARPTASIILTNAARRKLDAAGFAADAKAAEDLKTDLRVRLDREGHGERIKIFGSTLWAVAVPNEGDPEGETELCIIDAGLNPGPTHESNRRSAEPCSVKLRLGRGSGKALLEFARDADRNATHRATNEVVERARLVVDIERERLPVFAIDAIVVGGVSIRGGREDRIGQASGYSAAQTERVEVNGAFRLQIQDVRLALTTRRRNVVSTQLREGGVPIEEAEVFDDAPPPDWFTMFDEVEDIDILNEHSHIVGKATKFDRTAGVIHVQTDKARKLLRAGLYYVKNHQKERQLRQQEMAIDAIVRGETARADMPLLLAEAAVHQMGDLPAVDLMQQGLTPEARVRTLVNRILASQTMFCLQGPPGTGKTTIIAEVVAQALELEPRSRILVCSQANDAVANAIERIRKVRDRFRKDWIIVRDVRPARAKEEGPWAGYPAAYREFSRRIKENAVLDGPPTEQEAIAEWVNAVEHSAGGVERDYHGLVQVWGTTTARSTGPLKDLDGEPYDLVIIDEAAKATVGEVLVPIVHARRLLLVGDQKQLPPFLEDTTREALEELGIKEADAKYSLFEHMLKIVPREHRDMLDVQFRMHPTIGDVVSKLFYDGKLHNGPGTEKRPLPKGPFAREHRVVWVNIEGSDYKVGKTSRANDAERSLIFAMLDRLDADAKAAGMNLEVAVISAYRGQADKLQAEMGDGERRWKSLRVKAATVDAFQGREADVVLYSLVRVGDAERKFIEDGRRFNVALSRAKSLLVLIGDQRGSRGTKRLLELQEMIPEVNFLTEADFVNKPSFAEQFAAKFGGKPPRQGGK